MSPAFLPRFLLFITWALIQTFLTHPGLFTSKLLNLAYLPCYWHYYLSGLTLSINQDLKISLAFSSISYLSLSWRLLLIILAVILYFAFCTWRFYLNQLHLAALPQPVFYFLCLAAIPWPHLAVPRRPIFYFLCLTALPQPGASGGSTLTNFLLSVPDVSTLINYTWPFYSDQFFTFCAWRFDVD